jgi:hypothetical protein
MAAKRLRTVKLNNDYSSILLLYNSFISISVVAVLLDDNRLIMITITITMRVNCYAMRPDPDIFRRG